MNSEINFNIKDVIAIARKAGAILMQFYNTRNIKISTKEDNSIVTNVDLLSNDFLEHALLNLDSDILFFSEENIDKSSKIAIDADQLYWLVDPLDGTFDFVSNRKDFSVSIALMKNNSPLLGVIYVPCTDSCYYAQKNCGAFKQHAETIKPIVNKPKKVGEYITFAISPRDNFSFYSKYLSDSIKYKIICYGSCSIKCCAIFDNVADIYMSGRNTMVWDTSAAHCIASESGAGIFQLDLTALTYNFPKVCVNPKIIVTRLEFSELMKLIR